MVDRQDSKATSSRVAELLEQLTLLEKAALLSGESVWSSRSIPRLGLRSAILSDGPHGVRRQIGSGDHLGINDSRPATCFPTAATVANSWDLELAEEVGQALGQEAAALGVDVLLGPGLNTKRSPLCGRNFEYFSEDPYLAGVLAGSYVQGIQSQGTAACPKHFAVNSQELRRMASNSVVDERTLRELYLTGFELVVRRGKPRVIMTSYNQINGTYANENYHLLQDILRDEWGYSGMVVTDWGGGNDELAAIRAGGGMEMPAPGLAGARRIVKAVKSGELDEAELDARVAEVLGLLAVLPPQVERGEFDVEAHHALARKAASRSVVLLRNENAVLPLAAGTRVALIGDMAITPRYQGAGSSLVNATRLETAEEVLAQSTLELAGVAQGYERQGAENSSLVDEAVAAAQQADVALVYLGLDELSESEGLDRSHMRLPDNQHTLMRALTSTDTPVVVVLSGGASVELPWAEDCAAIVHSYLSGQAGASAVVDILTGVVNPGGKLAETYPLEYADCATAGKFPASGAQSFYREGLFVGYRQYDAQQAPVRYPFGFGLSYSTFAYSDLKVTDQQVQFTITNTSDIDGDEIAQLYVSRTSAGIFRPVQELKGFTRVTVPAGSSVTAAIGIDKFTYRFFDVETNAWQVEQGSYELRIGSSSRDIRLRATVELEGTVPARTTPPELACYANGDICNVPDETFAALLGHPVPEQAAGKRELSINDPLLEMEHAPSALARGVFKILQAQKRKADATGRPDLNILFVMNMPYRAIGKMANGYVDASMVEAMVEIVNAHPMRGLHHLITGFFRNARANRATKRELENV